MGIVGGQFKAPEFFGRRNAFKISLCFRLQNDTLETSVNLPLNQNLETRQLAYCSLEVPRHQPSSDRDP